MIITMLKFSISKDSALKQNDESEFLSQMTSLLEVGSEYIGIINKKGRLEEVFYKQNDMNMTEEKKEMFFMTLQLHDSLQSDFDNELGQVNYITIERQNSRFVSITTSEGIILVKLNKSADPFFIINKITGILDSHKRFLETSSGVYQ